LWVNRGESVILVREETTPEDISSMHLARGFLTLRGGMTSHAAVVARQMAKPCITGCGSARLAASKKAMEVGTHTIREGDWITLDGSTGEVILGKVTTSETIVSDELRQLIEWSIKYQTTHVRANADTPADAQTAKIFGAQGIGLCRTEHMFFDPHRLPLVRQMILARSESERNKVLEELLPHQRTDFTNILCVMSGLPVTIRLLDPPLHEFLPHHNEDLAPLALEIGISELELRDRIRSLSEQNPMLGHRGCRLGISHPAIYEMQVLAICHATAEARALGQDPRPEIMIPLVGLAHELSWLRQRLERLCRTTLDDLGCHDITVPFGTMIEVPRAALTADELACHADFFSFGTNDLTQTTFGFSRDDSFGFLRTYEREGIVKSDPFITLDTLGVGVLMELAMTKGRATNPSLKFGICGEHAGDPESLSYLNSLGLDYVSCSPFRVPLAQLAMAQAALRLVAGPKFQKLSDKAIDHNNETNGS
jgi:pyruvate,orthophosphate dikinase